MRPHLFALLLIASVPLACDGGSTSTEVPASATTTVISLRGIDCEECGTEIIGKLQGQAGIYAMSFDRVRAELTVQHDAAQLDAAKLVELVHAGGYEALLGAGQGQYLPEVEFDATLDVVKIVEAGETVELERHLVADKVTIFDFYAVWCEPCREIDGHMQKLLAANPDVALRKINVVDWDSEVAKQHLREAPSLPYLLVYGPSGRKHAAIAGLELEQLDAAVAEARGR